MSLIISNKFRATLSILFPAVMATSPAADARAASPAPEQARPAEENVAENLLKAEMNSLVKMMADVSKVPEENKGTLHFVPENDDTDPARAQLDVLVKIQHSLVQQQTNQEAALKSQLVMCKMADSLGRLLLEQSRSFETQKQEMLQYMEKESNIHQNSMDQVETVVSKVGESLEGFTNTIGTLSTTLKDLSADQRTQNNQQDDLQRKMHYELQGIKDLCNHVRTNTLNTIKELKNVQWQVSEMRSGTADANGAVSSNKGSLIYLMHEDMKTGVQSIMEALESSVKALREAVQAGVNPEKSLKRKHQEYKESERAAKQKREEERKQQEAEQRQKEEERSRIFTVVHPWTGVKMSLTGEQYQDFIQDLTKFKPTDFAPLSGPGSVPVPPFGFPPSMGGALGGLPPPGGAPSTPAPGASLNASSPSTGGYIPMPNLGTAPTGYQPPPPPAP